MEGMQEKFGATRVSDTGIWELDSWARHWDGHAG